MRYSQVLNQPLEFFRAIIRYRDTFQIPFGEVFVSLFKCLTFLWLSYPILPPLYVLFPGVLQKFKDKFTSSEVMNFYDSPLYWSHLISAEFSFNKVDYVKQVLDSVKKQLSGNQNPHILEVGSGVGSYTTHLSKIGDVTTVDISRRSLSLIHFRLKQVNNVASSAEFLPFYNPNFDLAVCLDVLEHISDPRTAVEELVNSLKPKTGVLFTNYAIDVVEADHIGKLSLKEFENFLEEKFHVMGKLRFEVGSLIYVVTSK